MFRDLLPLYARYPEEMAIIGQILTAYADLEITLFHCVQTAHGDFNFVFKSMFSSSGGRRRINFAESTAARHYKDVGLKSEFMEAISAMRHCVKIRNQYAHGVFHDYAGLCVAAIEKLAQQRRRVPNLSKTRFLYLRKTLLRQQFAYLAYTDAQLAYVNLERRKRIGEIPAAALHKPRRRAKPPLFNWRAA